MLHIIELCNNKTPPYLHNVELAFLCVCDEFVICEFLVWAGSQGGESWNKLWDIT